MRFLSDLGWLKVELPDDTMDGFSSVWEQFLRCGGVLTWTDFCRASKDEREAMERAGDRLHGSAFELDDETKLELVQKELDDVVSRSHASN